MYCICLHDPRFPKKRTTLYIPAKAKYECANSALRQKRKKKEVYFSYMGKILKQVSWALFVETEWLRQVIMLEALGVLF